VEEMHREKLELSLSSIRRRAESVKNNESVCDLSKGEYVAKTQGDLNAFLRSCRTARKIK
jgi:hypothetical protein